MVAKLHYLKTKLSSYTPNWSSTKISFETSPLLITKKKIFEWEGRAPGFIDSSFLQVQEHVMFVVLG